MGMFGSRSQVVSKGGGKNLQQMELEEFRKTMEQIAREDADKMAIIRDSLGITQSLQTPEQVQEAVQTAKGGPTTPTMVDVTDTDQGKLTNVEPLVKLSEEIREDTIKTEELPDQQPADLPVSESRGGVFKMAEAAAQDIAIENIGIDETMWEAYKKEVAKIESGGNKAPYQVAGGANDHYDGKYQLGKMAKLDAAQLLGITLTHDKEARENFRNNPALQEKAFAAYTAKNHSYLMAKSDIYRTLDKEQQIAVLGYAHNQGWSEAKKWLAGGSEGQDAFGTKGSKYYKAIANNLGISPSLAFTKGRETSPRPQLRPEE